MEDYTTPEEFDRLQEADVARVTKPTGISRGVLIRLIRRGIAELARRERETNRG